MSRKPGLQELESQLRAKPPKAFASLSEEEMDDLVEAVREARYRQAAELHAAGERAFERIPWLLRGPIRRVMGA